ncbi:30S ribosomal protein S16 [Candidatus Shapirobacteria bacterium]|nr:MAG: 30S ribosomal protein S16 [Candidatus Shapirobacteria bacterium]
MLRIRLFPKGKKHQRTFRIVVAERRTKANGRFVEDLGYYTPQTKVLKINKEKMDKWIKQGAQISLGVNRLLDPKKYPKKKKNRDKKKESPTKEKTPSETKTEIKKEK